MIEMPMNNGITNLDKIISNMDELAAVIIQSPNSFGLIENWELTKNKIKDSNALLIAVGDPIAFSVLKTPGECGADIYVGEGQVLGNPMNYGGPLLGLMAIKEKYKRRMPGRIIGKTVDKKNNPGFVLTLQTREQHIRRDKATSNICTNQGLLALRATIYLSLMGRSGLQKIGKLCYQKAQYAAKQISALKNYSLKFGKEFLKEFVIETSSSSKIIVDYCLQNGILIQCVNGDESDSLLLIAITEKRTKVDIDKLVSVLEECQ
jgi:glycine dehydrogenase subunit 1